MSFPSSNDSNSDTSEGTISSITLTPEEVYHVLVALNESKATGLDKIPAKLLKNCASSVCSSLCVLFNKSLSLGKLPYEWKLSNIIPIPKKGAAEEVSNYRPISLLSLVSKVFERCIYNQLISHISTQLHHLQFGFLQGKSTTSQLLHVLQARIPTKRWRIEAKLTLSIWILQKRSTRLVTISCWLNFTSLG
jgi:hypothetical protein